MAPTKNGNLPLHEMSVKDRERERGGELKSAES